MWSNSVFFVVQRWIWYRSGKYDLVLYSCCVREGYDYVLEVVTPRRLHSFVFNIVKQ